METNPEYEEIYSQQEQYRILREQVQQQKQLRQQSRFQNMNYPYSPARSTNGLAIASLICSLASLMVPLTCVVGIILGFIGLYQINNDPDRYEGKGLAIAGIIIGAVMTGIFALIFIFYFMMIWMYGFW